MLNFKRVLNFALVDFKRNKGISIAAIFVLIIATLLLTGLFFIQGLSSFLISSIQNKIDIAAYFKEDVQEQEILNAKEDLLKISIDIKDISYVSKEDALDDFTQKHKDNEVFLNALGEVGVNPFLPSLNITTKGSDPAEYEKIAAVLQQDSFSSLIEKVDFSQKKDTIDKVFSITSNINKFGLILFAVLILVAVLVVFNTIKLVIDRSRDEIATMRIVGASDWFVRSPFIIQGAIYGLIFFAICFFITILLSFILARVTSVIMPGFNSFDYFISNIWIIILIQLGFGVLVGVTASFVVVRKYLKV